MFDTLRQYIEQMTSSTLSEEEAQLIRNGFTEKKMRRKQFLLHEGTVCKYIAFVVKGAMRLYSIDEKGNEHIVRFGLEGWWMSDRESFTMLIPSRYNIDAIEDCELLIITNEQLSRLRYASPAMTCLSLVLDERHYFATQKRIESSISYTAEEKVLHLMNTYPQFLQRLPQNMVASYLGLTPETLSRVRKK
jgi:CRP-like cAMP-binding protein